MHYHSNRRHGPSAARLFPEGLEPMHSERPVNLALTKFSFPLPALASITHRITGIVLFGGMAVLLWLLDLAASSPEGFTRVRILLAAPGMKLVVLAIVAALIYHVVAGVKHLFMDFHIGDTLAGGRLGAQLSIAVSVVLIALAGAWIW
jgi:succinate dehydrogenase / fumarate reductase cytochrome b subunit